MSTPSIPTADQPKRLLAGTPSWEKSPPRRGAPKVGETLGKLLLTDAVGEGATGKVFRALHQTLKIPVAVKLLESEELDRDPSLRDKLRGEAQLLAQLSHPNIVRVWDFDDGPDLPYLVLEIVEGPSLADLIGHSGRLAPRQALEIVLAVADGLGAACRLGIIHRDVKPANILITRDRVPKLVDLGLAVVTGSPAVGPSSRDSHPGLDIAGSPVYMAPEQFTAADSVDHRSDIYSLGVTFYQAVTGRLPFEGRSLQQLMLNKAQAAVPPPHEVIPGIVEEVSAVILRMMEKDPDDRPQSYEELLAELRPLRHQPGDEPPLSSVRLAPRKSPGSGLSSTNFSSSAARTQADATPLEVSRLPAALDTRAVRAAETESALPEDTSEPSSTAEEAALALRLAQAAHRSGDGKAAREFLRRAIRLDPCNTTALYALALVSMSAREQIGCLSRVLALDPAHQKARVALKTVTLQAGVAAARRGDVPTARDWLRRAVELDSREVLGWLWLARMAASRAEAVAALRHVLDLAARLDTPGVPDPAQALALAALDAGQTAQAARHLEGLLRRRPHHPAFQEEVQSLLAELARDSEAPPRSPNRAMAGTVLIVDDSPTIRKMVSRTLQEYDYHVVEASDGPAALACVAEEPPGLVLLDVSMPGLDGYEVCRAIRGNPAHAALPIVFLTSRDGLFEKRRGRRLGANEYLVKPVHPQILIQVVAKYCRVP